MVAKYDATELSGEGTEAIEELARQLPEALILSSDLPRAQETAQIIARNGSSIKFSPLFRELKSPRIATGLMNKLWAPPSVWSLVHWLCWIFGIGEFSENPQAALRRAALAADEIFKHLETEEKVILVSHGWFMIFLAVYLRKRGLIARGHLIPRTGFGAVTEYLLKPE
jgi:broad specificity phosphatase PhoE